MAQANDSSTDWREPRLGAIESPALLATLLIHALAILAAIYVARAGSMPSRPAASATMTLIELSAESGGGDDRLPPVLAASVVPTLATAVVVDAPPAPVVVSIASAVATPAGSPGSSGFDPYAGASPVQLAVADDRTGSVEAPDLQTRSQAQETPLDAGLADLRNRLMRAAQGVHGSMVLQVSVDNDGIVRDVRVVTSYLTPAVSSEMLLTQARGLRLFPASEARPTAWLRLPSIQL